MTQSRCAGWLALAGVLGLGVSAAGQSAGSAAATQAPAAAGGAYVPTMTFDVASVRENKEADLRVGITMSGSFVPHTTMLHLTNWTIENLVSYAYGVDEWQVVGYPHWTFPTVFVIEAKGDADADAKMATLTKEQQWAEQQHMMQVLLADRFKLKVHWETRDGQTYDLVVAKAGRLRSTGAPPSGKELKNFGDRPMPALYQQGDSRYGFHYIAHGATTEEIAKMLAIQFGSPVSDKTGLAGNYDFDLKYYQTKASERKDDETDPWPPLETAIQDQLGLKLAPTKGQVHALVIDHVERPGEN